MTAGFARSFLFVPSDRPKFVDSAFRSTAEAVVFDLEDSVAADRKAGARDAVRGVLTTPRVSGPLLYVRVNGSDTPYFADDLLVLAGMPLAGLVIPKVESAPQVRRIAAESGGTALVLLLESPRALLRALDIGEAADGSLAALAFGAEDFRAAMCVSSSESDALVAFAMPAVAVAAAALGVPSIDAPEMDLGNAKRLRARAVSARALGFQAKFAIHPAQLPIIHDVFAPTPAQRAWAERVTRAYEESTAEGRGSIRVDDRVVDVATIKRARQILTLSGP